MTMQANWRTSCKEERSVQTSMKRKSDETRLLAPSDLQEAVDCPFSVKCQARLLLFYDASLDEDLDVSIHSVRVLNNYSTMLKCFHFFTRSAHVRHTSEQFLPTT